MSTSVGTTTTTTASSSEQCSYTYESAVNALLSSGIHQATTKEDIARSALRRTKTISDMRWYWNKILRHTHNGTGAAGRKRKLPTKPPLLIHVTGTKGKGSTACMCEAILRAHGYSTGLCTSPHLMDIRERIRWNGRPVHESIFADVYWTIRKALESESESTTTSDDSDNDSNNENDPPPRLPGYFRMLTLMGLYTFLHYLPSSSVAAKPVDAIVLEVGMGGRYDATNFLNAAAAAATTTPATAENFSSVAHGVTLLDLDHTRILGNTLEKIAWEKGGIFSIDKLNPSGTSPKPAAAMAAEGTGQTQIETTTAIEEENVAVVHSEQGCSVSNIVLDSNTPEVVRMMKSCARVEGKSGTISLADASGTQLRTALHKHGSSSNGQQALSLGLAGSHQYGNATLAVALCQAVTGGNARSKIEIDSPTTLRALAGAAWPGRCQKLLWSGSGVGHADDNDDAHAAVEFFLDGAHTPQSLEATVGWFRSRACCERERPPILVFNCSHERNPVELLELLLPGKGNGKGTPKHHGGVGGYARVYFAKSDSSRPSPVAKASAEELLDERGIPIRNELLLPPTPPTQVDGEAPPSAAARTWQETLACVWRHLTLTDDDNNDNDNNNDNNTSSGNAIKGDDDVSTTKETTQVFVTGSLYLVGSFLAAMDWKEESSPPLP
eukprot:jgi/Psemu1/201299/e_gw1.277.91.1